MSLLDNARWDRPESIINQRGQTEYTGAGYTIDRLLSGTNNGTVKIVDGGIELSSNSNGNSIFSQKTEKPLPVGETVTLSALLSNGKLYTSTGIVGTGDKSQFCGVLLEGMGAISCVYFHSSRSYENLRIDVYSGQSITIAAVKLELGSVQTLAHQDADGNWVLNDPPPNPALELAKCQRYYYNYNSMYNGVNTRNLHVFRLRETSDVPVVNVRFPVPMRINPTVTIFSGDGQTENAVSTWAANATVPDITVSRRAMNTGTLGLGTLAASAKLPAGTYSFHVVADANL